MSKVLWPSVATKGGSMILQRLFHLELKQLIRCVLVFQMLFGFGTFAAPDPHTPLVAQDANQARTLLEQLVAYYTQMMADQRLEEVEIIDGKERVLRAWSFDASEVDRPTLRLGSIADIQFGKSPDGTELYAYPMGSRDSKKEGKRRVYLRHVIPHFQGLTVVPTPQNVMQSPLLYVSDEKALRTIPRVALDYFFRGRIPLYTLIRMTDPDLVIDAVEIVEVFRPKADLVEELGAQELVGQGDVMVRVYSKSKKESTWLPSWDRDRVLLAHIPQLQYQNGRLLNAGFTANNQGFMSYKEMGVALGLPKPETLEDYVDSSLKLRGAIAKFEVEREQKLGDLQRTDVNLADGVFLGFQDRLGRKFLQEFNPSTVVKMANIPRPKITGAEYRQLFEKGNLAKYAQTNSFAEQAAENTQKIPALVKLTKSMLRGVVGISFGLLKSENFAALTESSIHSVRSVLTAQNLTLAGLGTLLVGFDQATGANARHAVTEFLMASYNAMTSNPLAEVILTNGKEKLVDVFPKAFSTFKTFTWEMAGKFSLMGAYLMLALPVVMAIGMLPLPFLKIRTATGEELRGVAQYVTYGLRTLAIFSYSVVAAVLSYELRFGKMKLGLRQKFAYELLDNGINPFESAPGRNTWVPQGFVNPLNPEPKMADVKARHQALNASGPVREYLAALVVSYYLQSKNEPVDMNSIAVASSIQAGLDLFHSGGLIEKSRLTSELLSTPEAQKLYYSSLPMLQESLLAFIQEKEELTAENFDVKAYEDFLEIFSESAKKLKSLEKKDWRYKLGLASEFTDRFLSRQVVGNVILGNQYRLYSLENRYAIASKDTAKAWMDANFSQYFQSEAIQMAMFPQATIDSADIILRNPLPDARTPSALVALGIPPEQIVITSTVSAAGAQAVVEKGRIYGNDQLNSRLEKVWDLRNPGVWTAFSNRRKDDYLRLVKEVEVELAPTLDLLDSAFEFPKRNIEGYADSFKQLGRSLQLSPRLEDDPLKKDPNNPGVRSYVKAFTGFLDRITGHSMQAFLLLGLTGVFVSMASGAYSQVYNGDIPGGFYFMALKLAFIGNLSILLTKYVIVAGYASIIPIVHRLHAVLAENVEHNRGKIAGQVRAINHAIRTSDAANLAVVVRDIQEHYRKNRKVLPAEFNVSPDQYDFRLAAKLAGYAMSNAAVPTHENPVINQLITFTLYAGYTTIMYNLLYSMGVNKMVVTWKNFGYEAAVDHGLFLVSNGFLMWLGSLVAAKYGIPKLLDWYDAFKDARIKIKLERERLKSLEQPGEGFRHLKPVEGGLKTQTPSCYSL